MRVEQYTEFVLDEERLKQILSNTVKNKISIPSYISIFARVKEKLTRRGYSVIQSEDEESGLPKRVIVGREARSRTEKDCTEFFNDITERENLPYNSNQRFIGMIPESADILS